MIPVKPYKTTLFSQYSLIFVGETGAVQEAEAKISMPAPPSGPAPPPPELAKAGPKI